MVYNNFIVIRRLSLLHWIILAGLAFPGVMSAETPVPMPPILLAGAAALPITPVDENGRLWQEPFEDADGNGRYDAPDPQNPKAHSDPFTDLNENGKWDGPYLAGFSHKEGYYVATGAHDPVWARALVLEIQDTKLALVALDLVGYLYPEVLRIRQEVSDLGLDLVVVAGTHTHGGTDSIGLWGPNPFTDGKDPRFMDHIRRQTVAAIRKAHESRLPARLRFGQSPPPIAFGRLVRDKRDPIVIDNRLVSMKVEGLDGQTIATVVNWSPHPETLGGESSLITSDFPHYLREGIEKGGFRVRNREVKGLGGVALYFSGAVGGLMTTLGAQVRDESGKILPQRSWEKTERIGLLAAWSAIRSLEEASPAPVTRITVRTRQVFVPLDNKFLIAFLEKGVLQRERYHNDQDLLTELDLITFHGETEPIAQMVTIPGELFPEMVVGGHLEDGSPCWTVTERKMIQNGIGKERTAPAHPGVPHEPILLDHLHAPYVFVLGLANDELGYIVPANDFVFPRYTPAPRWGVDRCGDDDHYEETLSAGSKMAPILTQTVIGLIKEETGIQK
jgi:hypothetical protein